ncbi:hypothetical protein NC652_020321 [Populus alba x Populus x berolinensis]|nr:hypothetical protein NC652_020321 [Populus alba x Populus x berolinensis]
MEVDSVSSHSNEKRSSEHSTSTNGEHMNTEKEKSTSVFVNHAAIAWHESRRKWTGNQSRQPQRTTKDPIIRVHIVNLASAINEEKIRTLLHFLMADTESFGE